MSDKGVMSAAPEKASYSIMLHPHRSLSPKGFTIFMICIAAVSFAAGLVFLMLGAWPVFGFFGLDVLLIYIAFKLNFKSGRRCEIVEIRGDEVRIRHIAPDGQEKTHAFQAYWARPFFQKDRLFIGCRGEQAEIGEFLIEDEKEEVKGELDAALYRFRNNQLEV